MTLTFLDYIACALFIALLFLTISSRKRRGKLPLPPGPRGWPILGNIFDLPTTLFWERYRDMGLQYGGLMSLSIPGQTIIVINSLQVARDLLDKRGQTWSERPYVPLVEMMEFDQWSPSFKSHSKSNAHRLERRIADNALRPAALAQPAYRSIQQDRVYEMLRALSREPERFVDHIGFMLTGIILSVAYGYELERPDDPFLVKAQHMNEALIASVDASASIVNIFPIFRYAPYWFPGMGAARDAPMFARLAREIREEPYERVLEQIRNGTAKPSMTRDYVMSRAQTVDENLLSEPIPESDKAHITNICAILYQTAVDTTGTTITNFLLACLLYPEVQKRAQAELDAVTGRQRLPGFEDKASLPYVQAICLELQRWRLVSPLGLPHSNSEDDVYEGYFIPKNCTVLANLWAMLHDPERYPDPESFRPERFLSVDGKCVDDPTIMTAFGFGRRICPGRFLAPEITFLTVITLLSVFDITPAKDAEGKEVPVNGEWTTHSPLLSVPLPFKCSMSSRDEKARNLVEATATGTDACDD